jgi:hypothetical protein
MRAGRAGGCDTTCHAGVLYGCSIECPVGYDCCTVLEGRMLCTPVEVENAPCRPLYAFVSCCVRACAYACARCIPFVSVCSPARTVVSAHALSPFCACALFACAACVQPGYVYEHAWARVLLGSGCVYEHTSLWNGLRYSAVLALRRPRGAAEIDHLFGSRGSARVACPARLAVRRRRRLPSQPAGLFSERTVLFCFKLVFFRYVRGLLCSASCSCPITWTTSSARGSTLSCCSSLMTKTCTMLACMHSVTAGGSSWHCLRIPPYGSHAPQSCLSDRVRLFLESIFKDQVNPKRHTPGLIRRCLAGD